MSHVDVTVTSMGFSVAVNQRGIIKGTSLGITEYSRKFEHNQYDRGAQRWLLVNEYFHFYPKEELCFFPKYDLPNFILFLERNFLQCKIIHKDGVVGTPIEFLMLPWVDYKNDKQKGAVEYLSNPESGHLRGLALATGVGKGQPASAAIKTPSGWTTMGDIKLGELVSTPDGGSAPVVGIYPQGLRDTYSVIFEDGRSTRCDDTHLWKVSDGIDWKVISTEDLIALLNTGTKLNVPIPSESIGGNLSINPYISEIKYTGKEETQCIMVDHPDHLYITDDYIVTHNTVSYIWSLKNIGTRSMTTMTSRLSQWVDEMKKYTTLDEDDIYVVQGVGALTKLFNQIDKQIKPKVILASTKTIRLYLDYGPGYQHLPHPSEMCEKLGIGIVGTDEAHEHFYTNYLINLILNPAIFIPITATFNANDPFVKNIFDQHLPRNVQFTGGENEPYCNVTSYAYESGGYLIKPFHYSSPQGYSQVNFEKWLLGRGRKVLDSLVNDAFLPIIREHYINLADDGEKFLFLCSTTKMCDHLKGILKQKFPNKTVTSFYSGIPVNVLEKYDMILSTPGSAGTGRDVKRLRTCFVFENTGAENRNIQFLGRLRRLPENTPEYVYLHLSCIPQHQSYAQKRAMLYGSRAKLFRHRTIR